MQLPILHSQQISLNMIRMIGRKLNEISRNNSDFNSQFLFLNLEYVYLSSVIPCHPPSFKLN